MQELIEPKNLFSADLLIVIHSYNDGSKLCIFLNDNETKPHLLKLSKEKFAAVESFFEKNDRLPLTLGESSEQIFQLSKDCRIVRKLQLERRQSL